MEAYACTYRKNVLEEKKLSDEILKMLITETCEASNILRE
jgi:hypothetical protein